MRAGGEVANKLLAALAKHKALTAGIVGGGALLLYLSKSQQQAATAAASTASGGATTSPLIYPSTAQGSIPSALSSQTSTNTNSNGSDPTGQLTQIESVLEALYAQQQAQFASPAAATTGAIVPNATASTVAAPLQQTIAAMQTPDVSVPIKTVQQTRTSVLDSAGLVQASSASGIVVSSKSYKDAVDAAGGVYQNHVFTSGGYEGATFVPRAVTTTTAQSAKGQNYSSTSYKAAVDAAGGVYQNHVFEKGTYQGNSFVATPAASGSSAHTTTAYVPKAYTSRFRMVP